MKRGKNQSLYKYLPETWIDFSVRGKERKQYIAKVERWNGVKLENVNAQRLIRTVNDAVQSFASQSTGGNPAVPPVLGFGAELDKPPLSLKTWQICNNRNWILRASVQVKSQIRYTGDLISAGR